MKKLAKLVLSAVLAAAMTASLASCGDSGKTNTAGDKGGNTASADSGSSGGSDNSGSADAAPAAVSGTTYDTGMFTVTVPDGWFAAPVSDMFDNYDGDFDPTSLTLIKGGKEDWDSLDHAYIRISLYDKDGLFPSKDLYDDSKDLDPVTVSGFDCTVFSCSSGDYPYIILEGTNDKNDISFSLLLKNDQSTMEYGDADVQTILKSVSVK